MLYGQCPKPVVRAAANREACFERSMSTPGFLLRLVEEEERRTVASQIEQDVVAVVERMNETLVECPDSP